MTGDLSAAVGKRVGHLRRAAGLTQQELSRRIGMARASVANIEAGRQNIGVDQLEILANALGIGPAELVSGEGPAQLAVVTAEQVARAIDDAEQRALEAAILAVRKAFTEVRSA